ncbi:sensor histidine kinase [Dactylosporangium sp. CA-233914]|uniref:sensor histidine kinase n=1 Tax=Dactylosporangium sp. CA-233914 TaxID=3239934 RepID=UPI003D9202F8
MNAVWAARARRAGRVVLVVILAGFDVTTAVLSGRGLTLVAACVAVVVSVGALLVGRVRWPVAAPLAVTGLTVLVGSWQLLLLLCVALFDLAADRRARRAWACVAFVVAVNVVRDVLTSGFSVYEYSQPLFFMTLAIVAGLWAGGRRRMMQLLADQVEHLKTEAVLREEAARSKERARIAAEMHDVLAHRLSLIALHTGVLVARGEVLPERVTDRLRLLRTASTDALADLRDVLDALRFPDIRTGGGDGAGGRDDGRAPTAPAVGQVQDLVAEARAAGQRIELSIDGDPDDAPTTHRLAVYRVAQEALTNARKHAAGASVVVRVHYRQPATTVEVVNAAGAPQASLVGSGYGLVGLRERISALGGHLTAGPAEAGSWRLTADMPHPPEAAQNRQAP